MLIVIYYSDSVGWHPIPWVGTRFRGLAPDSVGWHPRLYADAPSGLGFRRGRQECKKSLAGRRFLCSVPQGIKI